MNNLLNLFKFSLAFSLTLFINATIVYGLLRAGLTTSGALGVYALILTVLPGFTTIKKRLQNITFMGKDIDLIFLSSIAVGFITVPVAVFDTSVACPDRWGYGITGALLSLTIICSVLKNKKAP
ncbi:hypothetical protein [Cedecea neteri]|uniref:hypothetical protein n=1 Tax=Cedecea neteri TaxID=158822 RepID=UPI0012DFED53|nr:hypothetical protein [Cedecea neteri]